MSSSSGGAPRSRVRQEIPIQLVVLRLVIGDAGDGRLVEAVDDRARTGEEDGRVRGDHELGGAALTRLVERVEKVELGFGRKRGLRLVEEVEALDREAGVEVRHERLPVRLGEERFAAVVVEHARIGRSPVVDNAREILEELGGEIGAGNLAVGPVHRDRVIELALVGVADRPGAGVALPDVDAAGVGEGGEQGGLARAVLAGEEGDRGGELEPLRVADHGQVERVGVVDGEFVRVDVDASDVHVEDSMRDGIGCKEPLL